MRILLAAKHPPAGGVAFGGVASWMASIQKQLTARGHECVIWGPTLPEPLGRFDVGVFSNVKSMRYATRWCERVAVISHGIIDEERPHPEFRTIFTAEEIRDHWGGDGPVLRQPIDLEFWRPYGRGRRLFVFYSYRAPSIFGLDELAGKLGLEFVWLKDVDAEKARVHLQGAALVAASGRAALEAMACGAPTMICDWRPYNKGPLVCPDLWTARAHNYSGRGGVNPERINLERFAHETMAFQEPRLYVETYHDSVLIADELLDLC